MSKKNRIKIVNPRDAGQLFTSEQSGADMVRRGAAVYVTAFPGSLTRGVRLIDDAERRRARQNELALAVEIEVSRQRGDVFFWDGCQPGAKHLPSFGKQAPFGILMERPGNVSAGVNPNAFDADAVPRKVTHNKIYPPLAAS